jgi:FdhD protein
VARRATPPRRVKTFEVRRIKAGVASPASEDLIVEKTVSLIVNGEKLLSFQCLPEMLEELAVGFLITEGLASAAKEILSVTLNPKADELVANLQVGVGRLKEFREALISGSSCGKALSSGQPLDPLDCRRKIDLSFRVAQDVLLAAMGEFRARAARPGRPKSVHAAAIASGTAIVAFAEDVGRHNAVDKVVGACVLQGVPLHDRLLLTTGRISFEVAAKALRAGIPVISSLRGPTAAAVELARDGSITLTGFVTTNSMTLYSAEWRITSKA